MTENRTAMLLWLAATAFFLLNAATQQWVSPTADRDYSEQLLLSQFWQWGYGEQPPLYTWLVAGLFSLGEPSMWLLRLLKVALMSLFMAAYIGIGRELRLTSQQLVFAVAGLVFIPQLLWEAQRDLTHSVLAVTCTALLLWQVLRLRRQPGWPGYAVLGLLCGLTLLGKYNAVLYLGALLIAAVIHPATRRLVVCWRFLLVPAVTLLVLAPHLLWVSANWALATTGVADAGVASSFSLRGLPAMLLAGLAFLSPWWLASLPLLWLGRPVYATGDAQQNASFLRWLFMVVLVLMAVFVVLSGAERIKDRWFLPLWFFAPLLLAAWAGPQQQRYWRNYLRVATTLCVLVALLLPGRTLLASRVDTYTRPNYPYQALLTGASLSRQQPGLVLAASNLLAGNARLAFPGIRVDSPSQPMPPGSARSLLILCEPRDCGRQEFANWLATRYQLEAAGLAWQQASAPYLYAPQQQLQIRWAVIDRSVSAD